MPKTIEARILPTGRTVIHVQGAQGGECLKLTEALVARLGTTEQTEPTAELYQRTEARQQDRGQP